MQYNKFKSLFSPILLATPLSLILTFYLQVTHGRLNNDAYIYFKAAKAFIDSGIQGAMTVYPWPFYPMLIGLMSQLTHLDFAQSAYTVNALLHVFFTLGFVCLVRELGGDKKTQWFALLIIFVHPLLAELRIHIYRDYGFWAFLLIGLTGYLRYLKTQSVQSAAVWSSSLAIAGLFRVEGWILLALLPFYQLMKPLFYKTPIRSLPWGTFLRIQVIPAVCGVVAMVVAFGLQHHGTQVPLGKLTVMQKFLTQGLTFYHEVFAVKVEAIGKLLSPHLNPRIVMFILFFGMLLAQPLIFP